MPRLQISVGDDLYAKTDAAWQALMAANDPQFPDVLVRGNEIVRMTERGELESYNVDSISDTLSRVAAFGQEGKEGEWSPKDPPRNVASALLARDSAMYVGAPRVDRVVDVPVLSWEGGMLSRPGHHQEARLYYRPAEGLDGVEGGPDTTQDVEEARELLIHEYLGDFGFADEGSRAHALALLLLPFVRDYIPGPTPMHVILAPDIGSGKTTLAQACLLPGCGLVPANAGASGDDEWRKRITSALLGGTSAILLDNLSGSLDSGALAAALTTGTWSDRVLGESREVHLPVRNIWAATGNNLGLSAEQVRRAIPVFLDPGDVRPADRGREAFRHPDLLGWGQRSRRELVRAALTLVEHWHRGPAMVEGGYIYVRSGEDPLRSRRTMGSFEGWAAVMGGILEACGVGGFLSNRDRLRTEADDGTREATEFLRAWLEVHPEPLELRGLAALCGAGGQLSEFVPTDLPRGDGLQQRLSYWLRAHRGVRFDGIQLVALEGRRRLWQVRGTPR